MSSNKFFKVSFEQFIESSVGLYEWEKNDDKALYDSVKLPKQATPGSAGHDFFSPFSFTLNPGESIKIPTGIRVRLKPGRVLMMFPRSGLGFKYRLQLDNTVGVIDAGKRK